LVNNLIRISSVDLRQVLSIIAQIPSLHVTMDRIERIRSHLNAAPPPRAPPSPAGVFLAPREASLAVDVYDAVLTPAAVAFVSQVAARFAGDVAAVRRYMVMVNSLGLLMLSSGGTAP
jgi:hypothetical protein